MNPTATRSLAQVEAARKNGSRSRGPLSAIGKAVASINPVQHGVASSRVLMPDEQADDYDQNVRNWLITVAPRTPGEAELAARLADVVFRQHRLDRLEEKLTSDELDRRINDSELSKKLVSVREAAEALAGLARLAEGVLSPIPFHAALGLLPVARRVVALAATVGNGEQVFSHLGACVEALAQEGAQDVPVEKWNAIAIAAKQVESATQAKAQELEQQVEAEKKRLLVTTLLTDSESLRMLDRHRQRLARELERTLAALKALQALTDGRTSLPGSLVGIKVEVRLVGRTGPRY
jgi:hypothetical protein